MADRYANIRKALAMGPTPGPWEVWDDVIYDDNDNSHVLRHFVTAHEADVVGAYGVEADRPSANADAAIIAACDPDTIRELLAERDALAEGLSDTEKDVAVAQAVEFAEYVERQAKGAMRDAAKRFLSLPYSHEVAKRLAERDALTQRCEWQPIETAPQDGREFLSVANYTDEPSQVQIVDWDFVQQCQPGLYTHWMPLPEQPEAG